MTTVCAISTPPGQGAIALIRITGHDALNIANKVWNGTPLLKASPRKAHLGYILHPDGEKLDQVLLTIYHAPASFTGEDMIEISCHGSKYIQQAIINTLIEAGAEPAGPGEFSRRAVINGRLDLAQAEAIADIISSESKASARHALSHMQGTLSQRMASLRDKIINITCLLELEMDFSEEDIQFASRQHITSLAQELTHEINTLINTFKTGKAIKEGIPVAIIGATNAGKSSLLNALLQSDRAIISHIPGTTRDTIEDTLPIGEYIIRIIDTAGLRHTDDPIEAIGIQRSYAALKNANIILHVTDPTTHKSTDPDLLQALSQAAQSGTKIFNIINKTDLLPAPPSTTEEIKISALTGAGIETLKTQLHTYIDTQVEAQGDVILTNARHVHTLKKAADALQRTLASISSGESIDIIAADLRNATNSIGEITGQITTPELLSIIFSRFCIGK